MGRITGCRVCVSLMSFTNSTVSLAIHSSLWGDAKVALQVGGRPSDVRFRTGASVSTSGASPVVTVAPVEGTAGALVEVKIGEERAPVEVREGSGLDAPVKVTSGAEK